MNVLSVRMLMQLNLIVLVPQTIILILMEIVNNVIFINVKLAKLLLIPVFYVVATEYKVIQFAHVLQIILKIHLIIMFVSHVHLNVMVVLEHLIVVQLVLMLIQGNPYLDVNAKQIIINRVKYILFIFFNFYYLL